MFDRGWEDAVRFLSENIIGLGLDRSVAILKGEKRLTGVNRLAFEDETDTDARTALKKQTDWTFAGTVFDGSRWWRPYATVDNWGPSDLIDGASGINRNAGVMRLSTVGGRANGLPRCVHYMNDKRKDMARWMDVNKRSVGVLWEEVPSPPIWYNTYNTMQWDVALAEYMTIGRNRLEARGHFQWYHNEPSVVTADEPPEEEDKVLLNENVRAAIERVEEKRRSYPPMPEPDKGLDGIAGWITPDGNFYACNYYGHINLADTLLWHIRKVEAYNPESDAEGAGWIKVAHTLDKGEPEHFLIMFHGHEHGRRPTPEQILTVQEWCKKHNEMEPYWVEDYIEKSE